VDWNNDSIADIVAGDTNGRVGVFLGRNTAGGHSLDSGVFIKDGDMDLNVGRRAAPDVFDWNGDGRKDLIVGNMDGKILIYLNRGTDDSPSFDGFEYLMAGGEVFDAGTRSAPRVLDWNDDGLPDLLVGEMEGHVYFLKNSGTRIRPYFRNSGKLMLGNGKLLRFPDASGAPRSRLFVTDWNNDGMADMLVGGGEGKVMLYLSRHTTGKSPIVFAREVLTTASETAKRITQTVKKRLSSVRSSSDRIPAR
jgi:hypothetical protein